MAEYLLEVYVTRTDTNAVKDSTRRARAGAEAAAADGSIVRFVRSIFMPADDTCFLLYEADSPEAIHEAARRAGLPIERVVEALSVGEKGAEE